MDNTKVIKRKYSLKVKDTLLAYTFLIPSFILLFFVILIPVLNTFINAFYKLDKAGRRQSFSGLDNFQALFNDPSFWQVSRQTFIWTVSMLVIATVISFILALLLNRQFIGRGVARTLIIFPWTISFVFVALLWRLILDPEYGHLNGLLKSLHIIDENIAWLATPTTAFASVIWVGITLTIPFTTIVLLAGLQSIPQDVHEAAIVDGASNWQVFRSITLPLLTPLLSVANLINLMYIFNSFPIIWVMTGGGPVNYTDTLVTYLYKLAFRFLDFGAGSALALLCFVVLMGLSIIYVKLSAKEVF
jgi:multiple sugar transport system permease protein